MLRFNTFRANRFLRSKFVEGKYLLASEATDLELEILDQLRKIVKETVGESVAIDDAWKIVRLNATQVLINPGQAWVKGLPFSFRDGKDQLVSGAILSIGTVPVGAIVTDDSNGLGKIITFNSAATTPTNLYRVVITAKEELITEVDDPFLQNVNLTESTAQKIRLNYQLNIVPDSLQTESPVPYRDETSSSLSVTNFPNSGGFSAPNFVNQTVVTPTLTGNGHLVALNVISGSEAIDGRDLELVIKNDPALSGGRFLPNSPTLQAPYSNGKLIDSHGNIYHINAIFNDIVSTQVVIRIDKEPDQPNPEIIDTLPYTLIKRDVFVTDDSNGTPQGRLHYPIATIDWNSSNGIVHASKIVDLRTVVSKQDATQLQLVTRDNLEMVGGGNVVYNPNTGMLTWPSAFNIVNPYGPLQTVAAGTAPLTDGGSLAYDMNLTGGGAIQRGTLSVTISSGGTTATLASVDLSLVRVGNVLVDSIGTFHIITAINDVADTVSAVTSMATGAAVIYKDAYGPGKAPLNKNTFILAVRSGTSVLIGGEEEEVPRFEDRNLKLIRGGTWSWGSVGSPTVDVTFTASDVQQQLLTSNTRWAGQSYTATLAGTLSQIKMSINRSGSPVGNIRMGIYSDNGSGLPNILLGHSDSVDVSTIPTGTTNFAWTFSSPITMVASTKYHAIVKTDLLTVCDASNTVRLHYNNSNPYAGGSNVETTNGGTSWAQTSTVDASFFEETVTPSGSGILTWGSDAFVQIPGLAEARNRIPAGTTTLTNDGDVAYVNINRVSGSPATLSVVVAAIANVVPTEDLLVIARRTGTDIILGNQSTLLAPGQSAKLYSQASDQNLAYTGATSTADGSPNYPANNYVIDGTSQTTAIGALDTALFGVSTFVNAIQWKTPVANFAALPASSNVNGDVRLTLDTRLMYTWNGTVWIETGRFKETVANFAALPATNNMEGDVRQTLDTILLYTWKSSGSVWIELGRHKDGVSTFASLPATNNLDGDVRETLDTRVLYTWLNSATAWVEMGYWKVPVANAAALPVTNNKQGDVRITLDTRVAYSWDSGTSSWKPFTGTGGGVKIIGGGTVTWSSPNLTFTANMFLEMKGLAYADNTISTAQSPIVLSSSLQVAYVTPNLATGGPSLTVTVGALSSVPANAMIIARRDGTDAIFGTSSTRLVSGQSTELYAQESIQTRNHIRSFDFLRSDASVTWSGTALTFTTDLVLEALNTRTGLSKTFTVLAAGSPINLTAGQIAYVLIDREAASGNVTATVASSVPTPATDNIEVIILCKRVDVSGTGYLHFPLSKQVMEPGQTSRIGSGGSNSVLDTLFNVVDATDQTKKIGFDAGGTTATKTTVRATQTANRTLDLPDITDTLVSRTNTEFLQNKRIGYNTFTDASSTGTSAVVAAPTAGIVSLTNGSLSSVSGIGAGASGQQVILENATGNQVQIQNESGIIINTTFASNTALPTNGEGIGISNTQPAGQVFTAGTTGSANAATASFWATTAATGNVFAAIYATSGGLPTGAALQTSNNVDASTITTNSSPAFQSILTFIFPVAVPLTSGTQYAVVFQGSGLAGGPVILAAHNTGNGLVYNPGVWTSLNPDSAYFSVLNVTGTGSLANQIVTGSGSSLSMPKNSTIELVYDSGLPGWRVVGGLGSGTGGSKNYLSAVTTSQSATPNTGNGSFELGSATGWSLAHSAVSSLTPTTVATATNSFSSAGGVHGGSAATNLTFSAISSGQLSGRYSGQLVGSATGTVGDMLISDAFNIDASDQAKVLNFAFTFKQITGTYNFSGTSANSLQVWIYDVTNAVWIKPAGVYTIAQSVGIGISAGSFQTTSNGTQYQIAIIEIAAPTGAWSFTVDDFFVGSSFPSSFSNGLQPTRTTLTSGTGATYTTPLGVSYLRIRMIGGGGGGGGSGSTGSGTTGGTGTTSTFAGTGANLSCNGGSGGFFQGGAGGGTNGLATVNYSGSAAASTPGNTSPDVLQGYGSAGAPGAIGGGGGQGGSNGGGNGGVGSGNSGSGGGGGGATSAAHGMAGGGSGGYQEHFVSNPSATYTYTVGTGGAGGVGTGGAGPSTGGAGAAGLIIIEEFYSGGAFAGGIPGGVVGPTGTIAFAGFFPSQAVSTGAQATLTVTAGQVDTNNALSANTYIIPMAGVYQIGSNFNGTPSVTGGGTFFMFIQKNGTTIGQSSAQQGPSTGGIYNMTETVSTQCSAGDVIRVQANFNGGGSPTATGNLNVVLLGSGAGGGGSNSSRVFSAPTITSLASGSGTYTPPVGVLYLKVIAVGGGGGGGSNAQDGATGAATTFSGTNVSMTASAGGGGAGAGTAAGAGGGASGGDINILGGQGISGANNATTPGGKGGDSTRGGGGRGAGTTAAGGESGTANSGGGGGGATTGSVSRNGGGAGGTCIKVISPVTSSYSYTVGAGGSNNGGTGGTGGSGIIIIEEHYN